MTRQQPFLAAKTAIAAGLAWVAAPAADPHSRPYFAPLAVLLVVQPTVYDSLSRAFQRVVGVVVGVTAALTVSHFLAPDGWSIGIIIAGLLLGWAVRLGPQGAVTVATARREHQGHELSSRWNVRGRAVAHLRMTLSMSQRILAEAGRSLDSGSEGAMQGSVPVGDEPQ